MTKILAKFPVGKDGTCTFFKVKDREGNILYGIKTWVGYLELSKKQIEDIKNAIKSDSKD